MDLASAISEAFARDSDLVEISPNANPPVCKIIDFGKFKYELQKKAADAKKHQKQVLTKEIKLGVNIADHDYMVKINHAKKFIEAGNKVKFIMQLRNRELMYANLANDIFARIETEFAEIAKIADPLKNFGRNITMTFEPKKTV